jgi:hypothetical protein
MLSIKKFRKCLDQKPMIEMRSSGKLAMVIPWLPYGQRPMMSPATDDATGGVWRHDDSGSVEVSKVGS